MAAAGRPEAEGRDRILAIADSLAEQDAAQTADSERADGWISLRVGGRSLALPVSHVRGVHRAGHITPLPTSPAAVRGLTNLRGRVIAVIDLAAQLGLGETTVDGRSRILDAELGRRRLGLLAERTDGLIKVRPSDVEPVAEEVPAAIARRAKGEVTIRSERFLLLDPEQILEQAEAGGDPTAEAR